MSSAAQLDAQKPSTNINVTDFQNSLDGSTTVLPESDFKVDLKQKLAAAPLRNLVANRRNFNLTADSSLHGAGGKKSVRGDRSM